MYKVLNDVTAAPFLVFFLSCQLQKRHRKRYSCDVIFLNIFFNYFVQLFCLIISFIIKIDDEEEDSSEDEFENVEDPTQRHSI